MTDPLVKQAAAPTQTTPEQAKTPLLEIDHLSVLFPVRRGTFGGSKEYVRAVDDVTLTLDTGETLGLVGESGCGKTTLARTIVRLTQPTSGVIRFRGRDVTKSSSRDLRPFRREVQMVFQDPQASLNPRKRIVQIISAGLRLRGVERGKQRDRVKDLLVQVGLDPDHANRYPHEFSGGQRQRIGISRALAAEPKLIILDEPVSALDVSVQAQVVNLLDDLQDSLGLSYIFVAHDLSVVRHVSDRIAVMYLGKIMELSASESLYSRPRHPYTSSLLDAIPIPDPDLARQGKHRITRGEPPSPTNPPPGCRFSSRCRFATDICHEVEPPLALYADGDMAACHHPLNTSDADRAGAVRSDTSPVSSGQELQLSASHEHESHADAETSQES